MCMLFLMNYPNDENVIEVLKSLREATQDEDMKRSLNNLINCLWNGKVIDEGKLIEPYCKLMQKYYGLKSLALILDKGDFNYDDDNYNVSNSTKVSMLLDSLLDGTKEMMESMVENFSRNTDDDNNETENEEDE